MISWYVVWLTIYSYNIMTDNYRETVDELFVADDVEEQAVGGATDDDVMDTETIDNGTV